MSRRYSGDAMRTLGHSAGILLALIGLMAVGGTAHAGETQPWSDRGVFVFGSFVLDFKIGIEAWGVGPIRSGLRNCSTDDYFCAEAGITNIVLPRDCNDIAKGHWSAGGIETDVLGKFDDPDATRHPLHAYGTGTLYLLGSSTHPQVVYEYDPGEGVRAFYYSWRTKADIVTLARKQGWIALKAQHENNGEYSWLITFDKFGACERNRTENIYEIRQFPPDRN
jgi:hypothetical protein